jgi:hypothetical protein
MLKAPFVADNDLNLWIFHQTSLITRRTSMMLDATDIFSAIKFQDPSWARNVLKEEIDLNITNEEGLTPLMFAVANRCDDIVRLLVQKGADINSPIQGFSPLIVAAQEGFSEIVQTLIDAKVDMEARTPDGLSALMAAARDGHLETVQLLLNSGADADAVTNQGTSALMMAKQFNQDKVIEVMEKHLDEYRGISPIDKLEGELYSDCVVEKTFFNSREEAMAAMERYRADELARLRDLFSVKPLPPRLKPLVQDALSEWQEIERNACSRLGMSRDQFLRRFEEGRQKFLDRDSEWILDVTPMGHVVEGLVKNMDWVNLFSWILPKADTESSSQHRLVGRMVTAMFYCELLTRRGDEGPDSEDLQRIEARWCLANEK